MGLERANTPHIGRRKADNSIAAPDADASWPCGEDGAGDYSGSSVNLGVSTEESSWVDWALHCRYLSRPRSVERSHDHTTTRQRSG